MDRSGKEVGVLAGLEDGDSPSLSADERSLALYRSGAGNLDVWIYDLIRGIPTKVTSDPGADAFPIWSTDGKSVVFNSSRTGSTELYLKPIATDEGEKVIVSGPEPKTATDWSRDGRYLLYRVLRNSKFDLFAKTMRGGEESLPVVATGADERDGQFSPDGRWVAYQSDKSGQSEVYVRPFPGPGMETQVSVNGGAQVRWRRDGSELFYVDLEERLTSVTVAIASDAQRLTAGSTTTLFPIRVGGAIQGVDRQQYVVSSDGQRFLVNTLAENDVSPVTLILNWRARR